MPLPCQELVDLLDDSKPTVYDYLQCGHEEIRQLKAGLKNLAAQAGLSLQIPLRLRYFVESAYQMQFSSGVLTVDFNLGTYGYVTLTQNASSLVFTGVNMNQLNNYVLQHTIEFIQDATGNRSITWPVSVKFPGGTPISLSTAANARDIVSLYSRDAGATWYAFLIAADIR